MTHGGHLVALTKGMIQGEPVHTDNLREGTAIPERPAMRLEGWDFESGDINVASWSGGGWRLSSITMANKLIDYAYVITLK